MGIVLLCLFHHVLALHVGNPPLHLLNLLLFIELVEHHLLVFVALLLVLFHVYLIALLQFLEAGITVTVELGIQSTALANDSIELFHLNILFLHLFAVGLYLPFLLFLLSYSLLHLSQLLS